jgi:hypothetical protein
MFRPLAVASICMLTCILCTAARPALAGPFALHVEAGDVDRKLCPVTVELKVPGELTLDEINAWAKPGAALNPGNIPVHVEPVKDKDGKVTSARLYWIEPALKAGEKKVYKIGAWALNGLPAGFEFVDAETARDLKQGVRLIWRHDVLKYDPAKHNETYKHFHQVYGFHDDGFITQGVGGKQFPHHRGLYMGWSKTGAGGKSYDTWHCSQGVALKHRGFVKERDMLGYVVSRSASVADWTGGDGKVIVVENREVTTWNVAPGVTAMDFAFNLTAGDGAAGDVKLDGDPQHAGFQFRAAGEVGDGKAKYVRPASAKDKGGDVWTDCQWVVATFKIKGKPYAVAHFDHPANPGTDTKQTVYSTRNYGRFGAFAKLELKKDQPLDFRYRVLVFDGEKNPEQSVEHFQALHDAWTKPVKVTIGPG